MSLTCVLKLTRSSMTYAAAGPTGELGTKSPFCSQVVQLSLINCPFLIGLLLFCLGIITSKHQRKLGAICFVSK